MDMDMEIYSSFKDTIQFTLDPFIFFFWYVQCIFSFQKLYSNTMLIESMYKFCI